MVRRTIRCLPALHGDCVRACLALCVLALACDLSRGGRVGHDLEKAFLAELGISEPPLRESGGDRGGPPHDYMVRVSAAMERYARQQQDSSSGGYATDGRPEAVRVTSYPAVSVSDRSHSAIYHFKIRDYLEDGKFPVAIELVVKGKTGGRCVEASQYRKLLTINGKTSFTHAERTKSEFHIYPLGGALRDEFSKCVNAVCAVDAYVGLDAHGAPTGDACVMDAPAQQPILVFYYGITPHRLGLFTSGGARVARKQPAGGVERRSTDASSLCQVHAWSMAFADISWSWVLQPLRVSLNYCSGRCPAEHLITNSRFNLTNHAFFRAMYEIAQGSERADFLPPPACVPKDADPLTILYNQPDGKQSSKILHSVLVNSCGCM